MTNNPLEPARILDRNGRATTVYRRSTAPGGARPLPAATVPLPAPEQTSVGFSITPWIADAIGDSAPGHQRPAQEGTALLTDDDAFAYLSLGLSIEWGAAMHSVHPDPARWGRSKAARRLADHRSPWEVAPAVAESVGLMREHGYSPKAVERMLGNGLRDHQPRGVLTVEQTATLFTRLHCVPPQFATTDNTAPMVRCLTDGTMPISLVEQGDCSQDALIALAAFAQKSREDEQGGKKSNGFLAAAAQDPGLWSAMTAILDDRRYSNPPAPSTAWKALKAYGASDCHRFGIKQLAVKTNAGITVGEVIRQARTHGMGDDEIEAALDEHRDRPETVLAIAEGAAPAIADGWL